MKLCISCNKVLRDECRFCSQCGQNKFVDIPSTIEDTEPKSVDETLVGGSKASADVSICTDVKATEAAEAASTETLSAGTMAAEVSSAVMTSEKAPSAEKAEAVGTEVPTEPKEDTETGQPTRKKASWGVKILTCFLCILITLFMILGSLFLLLRFTLSEKAINFAADGLDGKVSDIQVGFLTEDEDEELTLSEYVYENMGRPYNIFISEGGIEDLLNEDFIREFVAEALSDSVSYVLYDDGNGEITADDIAELLDDNSRAFEKAVGCSLDDLGMYEIGYDIENGGILEVIDFTAYEREFKDVFSLIRLMFSGIVEGILLAVIVILITCIFLLRRDKENACSSVGTTFIVTGGFYFVIVAATYILAVIANKKAAFGMDLYNALLNPLRLSGAIIAGALLIIGLIFIFIAKGLRKKYNKKFSE